MTGDDNVSRTPTSTDKPQGSSGRAAGRPHGGHAGRVPEDVIGLGPLGTPRAGKTSDTLVNDDLPKENVAPGGRRHTRPNNE